MMQQGFVMPQGGGPPQAYMMQGGGGGCGNLQPGVQYMQVVLPVEQARALSQNAGAVPMGRVPGPQMQMMPQQGCKGGKGGKGGPGFGPMPGPAVMQNWGNQAKGFQGFPVGFNNGGKGKGDADDGKFDDWVAKRMGKSTSSSASAPEGNGSQMRPEQQMRQAPQQRHAQMQQMPMGNPQQMQQWMLPSPQIQQQLQQQHDQQVQQQQLWMQQQAQQWWPQNNMGMQNGSSTDFGSGGGGGGDSPRTLEWRRKIAESISQTGTANVDDWINKRSEALADGPAHRAPTVVPTVHEEDDTPHKPLVPWEAVSQLFGNTKPWADVTDADEKKTQDEILQIIEEQSRTMQVEEEAQAESRDTAVDVQAESSLTAPSLATEAEPSAAAVPEPSPSTKASPPVPESTRSYAAAAKQTPKAAAKKAPAVSSPPAPEVEEARSNAPVEEAPTEPAELSQKPAQDAPGSTVVASEAPAPPAAAKSDVEKRKKALEKKLRQISDLEQKAESSGKPLNTEEQKKVATKASLQAELDAL